MAYQNMKAEMKRHRVTQGQVADYLGMSENNFGLKINERVSMTVDEAKAIQKKFFPLANLDYLLESDGNVPSTAERARASLDDLQEAMGDIFGEEDAEDIARKIRRNIDGMDEGRSKR